MLKLSKDGVFKDENCNIIIVTGHYGSGKTEFAVNLALALKETQPNTVLVDIDIVNPYFRSRERQQQLLERGVGLICSAKGFSDADVPALPPDIFKIFVDKTLHSVVDVGGDDAGARVLSRFRPQLANTPHALLFVLNANRPMTANCESALAYLRAIKQASRCRVTGIVNNTHLCGETTAWDIQKGEALCREVSLAAGVPFVCSVCENKLLPSLEGINGDLFPIEIHMKKPWE